MDKFWDDLRLGTFYSWDVLYLGRFVTWDVLYLGRFGAWDVDWPLNIVFSHFSSM